MVDQVDCVVVGAGVVGLAVARALALQGREVLVLEAANAMPRVSAVSLRELFIVVVSTGLITDRSHSIE